MQSNYKLQDDKSESSSQTPFMTNLQGDRSQQNNDQEKMRSDEFSSNSPLISSSTFGDQGDMSVTRNNGNIFNYSEFPLPPSSRVPMANNDNDDLLYSHYSMDKNDTKSNFQSDESASYPVTPTIPYRDRGGYKPMSSTSELVFRSANSTQRAMRELTQRRHEARQRKRAFTLLFLLFSVASTIYYVSNETYNTGLVYQEEKNFALDGSDVDMNSEPGSPNIGDISSLTSDQNSNQNDGDNMNGQQTGQKDNQNQDADANNDNEAPPEEEIIEAGKEFLQPFRYFADLTTAPRSSDSNFFFHIPRSGGQTIKDIVGKCLKQTLASEVGVRDGHAQDEILQVLDFNGAKYVNVDTTSIEGLHRAAAMGLASSGYSDVIASSYFAEVGMLFDLHHKGRPFVLLRDPIARAVSMYYYKTQGDVPSIDPSVTIEDYAQGNGIENNWVTRFLTGRMEGELTKEDLEQAKEIIARKFLIGFLDDGEETIYRVMKYFHLTFAEDETKKMEQEDCIKDLLKDGTNQNNVDFELPKKGSQAAALIKWQTQFDLKLFTYAKELFDAQTKMYGSKERKKELKKRKKDGH